MLYEVSGKHWDYLKTLANCGDRFVPWNPDWKGAYKNLTGLNRRLAPGTMTRGVFEARGWIEVQRHKRPYRYKITKKGRDALAEKTIQPIIDQVRNEQPLTVEEAEKLDEAPVLSKKEAEILLRNFRAFAPKNVVRNTRRFERSAIGRALKALYDGHCQICGYTFSKKDGTNYAEVHRLEALSEGGREEPRNMLVVCANCHRRLHYGRVEKIGWENNRLVLKINGKTHRIEFDPGHLGAGGDDA